MCVYIDIHTYVYVKNVIIVNDIYIYIYIYVMI